MKATRWCQRVGLEEEKHLRNVDSPSKHYCTACYNEMKFRYDNHQNLIKGTFHLAQWSGNRKELEMRAFFACVMPEISDTKADRIIKSMNLKSR